MLLHHLSGQSSGFSQETVAANIPAGAEGAPNENEAAESGVPSGTEGDAEVPPDGLFDEPSWREGFTASIAGSIAYDSAVSGSASSSGDTILEVTPSAGWSRSFPNGAQIGASASLLYVNYLENDDFDAALPGVSADGQFPLGTALGLRRLRIDVSGSVTPDVSRSLTADTVAETITYQGAVSASYPVSSRTSLSLGSSGTFSDSQNARVVDTLGYSVNLGGSYAKSSRLSFSASAAFSQDTVVSLETADESYVFTLGASGRLRARLNGSLNGGLAIRNSETVDYAPYLSAALNYLLSSRTSLGLSLSNDFDFGGDGETVLLTGAGLTLSHSFDSRTSASIGIAGDRRSFLESDNVEHSLTLSGSLNRRLTPQWSIGASASSSVERGDDPASDFESYRVSITTSYSF